MNTPFHSTRRTVLAAALALTAALAWPSGAGAATLEESISELQRDWEVIRYQTPVSEREKRFEQLAARAHKASDHLRRPRRAAGVGGHHRQLLGG
jgi:uncharacterized membrane protein YccC